MKQEPIKVGPKPIARDASRDTCRSKRLDQCGKVMKLTLFWRNALHHNRSLQESHAGG